MSFWYLLLTLNRFYTLSGVSIVDLEQVNACWVIASFAGGTQENLSPQK